MKILLAIAFIQSLNLVVFAYFNRVACVRFSSSDGNSPCLLNGPETHGQKASWTGRFPSLAQLFEEPGQGHIDL